MKDINYNILSDGKILIREYNNDTSKFILVNNSNLPIKAITYLLSGVCHYATRYPFHHRDLEATSNLVPIELYEYIEDIQVVYNEDIVFNGIRYGFLQYLLDNFPKLEEELKSIIIKCANNLIIKSIIECE